MNTPVNVHDLEANYLKYPEQAKTPRVPGALMGKIWVSDDFDEPMIDLWDLCIQK